MASIPFTRGNSVQQPFRFVAPDGAPFDLSASVLVFFGETTTGLMVKSTAVSGSGFAITNAAEGAAMLTLTPAESRLFSAAKPSAWEIEWRQGGAEVTLRKGVMVAGRGINTDA